MIRINLAKRKQAGYVGAGGTNTVSGKTSFLDGVTGFISSSAQTSNIDYSQVFLRIVLPIILCVAMYFLFDRYVTDQKELMAAELRKMDEDRSKLDKETAKIKGYEKEQAEIEKNSKIIQGKVDAVEKLTNNRDFALKALVALSHAVPKEMWIDSIEETETGFQLSGNATDMGMVGDFIGKLGQSIYFKDVSFKNTRTDTTTNVTSFDITARRE